MYKGPEVRESRTVSSDLAIVRVLLTKIKAGFRDEIDEIQVALEKRDLIG